MSTPSVSWDPYDDLREDLAGRTGWPIPYIARVLCHAFEKDPEDQFHGRAAWRTMLRWLGGGIHEASQSETRRFWRAVERAEEVFKRLGPWPDALAKLHVLACPFRAIAHALDVRKQTVRRWHKEGDQPNAEAAWRFIKLFSRKTDKK